MKRALIIAGPTGVGKTDLAVRLARSLDGELISCDSVQVYRHLIIGANKEQTPDGIKQHLVDFVELDQGFTAADFYEKCFQTVDDVLGRGKIPILVGGTGFYMDWIVRGRPSAPATDPVVLEKVEDELSSLETWKEKLAVLESVDPDYAASLSGNDLYRLKRALCVYRQTGNPLSSFSKKFPQQYDWRCFYLTADREALNRRIDVRCETMIHRGLVKETDELVSSGLLLKESSPGRSIGYQETIQFLESNRTIEDFRAYLKKFQAITRQYSRKQETWFAKMSEFKWIERPNLGEPLSDDFVEKFTDWFKTEKDSFEQDISLLNEQTRRLICLDKETNNKRMKKYSSRPEIFDSDSKIEEFLGGLNLD